MLKNFQLSSYLFFFLALSHSAIAQVDFLTSPLHAYLETNSESEYNWVRDDLKNILKRAEMSTELISFKKIISNNKKNVAKVICTKDKVDIQISASESEWSSTLYKALREMGFLFPHPSRQISPKASEIKSQCGKTITWEPRLYVRGFHLHNQHPNEWIDGLYLDKIETIYNYIKWIKRNQQNLIQFQVIKVDESLFTNHLKEVLDEAHHAKILTSLSVSFSLYQQKSWALLPWYIALSGYNDEVYLREGIKALQDKYTFQIMTFEKGTTEFTSAPYEKTLKWIEIARDELAKKNQMIFNKIHASSNQNKEPFGNFNYLPQFSHKDVGVLPHTVMAYSLQDPIAPVYGLENFSSMRDYLVKQSQKRPVLYYPETSYYISMDIDLPLFLTDYLVSRSEDMDLIEKHPVWGQVNFSTGQDMGYWMMDWTVALLNDKDYAGQPLVGLRLLNEDTDFWKKLVHFQNKHLKGEQLIQQITFSNLQDELNFLGKAFFTHFRKLLRDYYGNPKSEELNTEIKKLAQAKAEMPDTNKIKSKELKILMDVTFLRMQHALYIRQYLTQPDLPEGVPNALVQARDTRLQALELLKIYQENYLDYKGSLVDGCPDNPTSYRCGYAWTALSLYHWQREEEMVENKIYNPFYRNFYSIIRILF